MKHNHQNQTREICAQLQTEQPEPVLAPAPLDDELDERVVRAAQRGDPQALRQVYERYRARVNNLVLYSVGNPQQAQDVLQAVFLKVFRGLARFRFESRLATWIYRIAHNECQDYHRRLRGPHVPLEAILGSRDEIAAAPISYDRHAANERAEILQQAVMQLPFKMRETVILKYVEGLSYGEISRALGCAPGTVASRLNRALIELEERLRPFMRLL